MCRQSVNECVHSLSARCCLLSFIPRFSEIIKFPAYQLSHQSWAGSQWREKSAQTCLNTTITSSGEVAGPAELLHDHVSQRHSSHSASEEEWTARKCLASKTFALWTYAINSYARTCCETGKKVETSPSLIISDQLIPLKLTHTHRLINGVKNAAVKKAGNRGGAEPVWQLQLDSTQT